MTLNPMIFMSRPALNIRNKELNTFWLRLGLRMAPFRGLGRVGKIVRKIRLGIILKCKRVICMSHWIAHSFPSQNQEANAANSKMSKKLSYKNFIENVKNQKSSQNKSQSTQSQPIKPSNRSTPAKTTYLKTAALSNNFQQKIWALS